MIIIMITTIEYFSTTMAHIWMIFYKLLSLKSKIDMKLLILSTFQIYILYDYDIAVTFSLN